MPYPERLPAEDARQAKHAARIQEVFDRIRQRMLPRETVRRGLALLAMGEELAALLPNDRLFALQPQNSQVELPRQRWVPRSFRVLHEDGPDAGKAHGSRDGGTVPQLFAAPGYYRIGSVDFVARSSGTQAMLGLEWMQSLDDPNDFTVPAPYRNYQVFSWLDAIGPRAGYGPIEATPWPEPEDG